MACSSRRGSSSTVEPQPSKLMVRVRFPSPAPLNANAWHNAKLAHVAQSVEHLLGKEEVEGSIPFVSTITQSSSTPNDYRDTHRWQKLNSSAPSRT
ncbi:Translocase (modular protein) [Xanthomonas citri pv. citri]|nr:Translocase (modular protein) [Xanthomonas citri pv. citri]CEH65000.1 Translocase (modular protein) [Xanthomonas citri pv. citri]CEI06201.1 Translocase (modular protein) [Xanthomonas citri pv. citri]